VIIIASLFVILLLVLLLPFLVKRVEENLELFLFVMGVLAVTVSAQWALPLVEEALLEPLKITAAVLVAGLLFKLLRPAARRAVGAAVSRLGI
jgi:predicted cation transporter